MKLMFKPFLFLIILLTMNTFLIGSSIHYICDIDWTTALLSCVAGGATDMSIVAMDLNAKGDIVAMMQTLRLIGTLVIFPYWISIWCKGENEEEVTNFIEEDNKEVYFLDKFFLKRKHKIVFTFFLAIISGLIGLCSGIPAASMIFPMFTIMFFNISTNICLVTKNEKLLAQILAGTVVGSEIDASTFSSLEVLFFPIIILLISYFFINYLFSLICQKKGLLDRKSAMFASAPGGATDMTLIAADLGADLAKIALIQSFRAAYVVTVMPILITTFVQII